MFHHSLETQRKDDDDLELSLEVDGNVDSASMSGVVTSLVLDSNGQYRFKSNPEHGNVTYRLVQVSTDENGQPQLLASSLSGGQLQTSGGRITYQPAAVDTEVSDSPQSSPDGAVGSVYVMMSPDMVSGGQQQSILIPQSSSSSLLSKDSANNRFGKDDKRRVTHNEVERRRRNKINTWITHLGKLLPDYNPDLSKSSDSKGNILSKACEYITEQREMQSRFVEALKDSEQCSQEYELLQQQVEDLRQENALFHSILKQNGIELITEHDEALLDAAAV